MFKELREYIKHKFVEPFKKDLKVITDGHQDWRKTPKDNLDRMQWAEGLGIGLLGILALTGFNSLFLMAGLTTIGLLGLESINQYRKAFNKQKLLDQIKKKKHEKFDDIKKNFDKK